MGSVIMAAVCLLIVVLFAVIGRIIIVVIQGIEFPKCLHKFGLTQIKPLIKFKLPVLIGEIVFGVLARNSMTDLMEDYRQKWGQYCRMICLTILLLGAGMHIDLKGKGLVVLLLVVFAPVMEALSICLLGCIIFDMKVPLALAMGFTISAASPAVLVPPMLQLHLEGFGVKKGIPTAMISAASLQDVSVIIFFGISSAIALNDIKADKEEIYMVIIKIAYEIATGIAAGFILGYLMKYLKHINIKIKFLLAITIAVGLVVGFEVAKWEESRYCSVVTFSILLKQVWVDQRPDHQINYLFKFMTPFLFGTVGAAMVFSDIDSSILGYAFGIIFLGITVRWFSTIAAAFQKKFSWKEKIFMAFAWIPKATVQAALGGVILDAAKTEKDDEYIEFGNKILTISIISILLTAPPGSVSIVMLGKKLLTQHKLIQSEDELEGHVMDEQEEAIISEMIHLEIPEVDIDKSLRSQLEQSICTSNLRRARMRNLALDPLNHKHHLILATYQQTRPTEPVNTIAEENEFGVDLASEYNRPRIKSGELKSGNASMVFDTNGEQAQEQKQRSRRNSLVSLSRRTSNSPSLALSVGDTQDYQMDQIHQINLKWKEQKVQHLQFLVNQDQESESDTWERSEEKESQQIEWKQMQLEYQVSKLEGNEFIAQPKAEITSQIQEESVSQVPTENNQKNEVK